MRLRQKSKTYYADFETLTTKSKDYENLKHTDIWLWYIEEKESKIGDGVLGNTMDEFIAYLKKDKKSKIVYFHNLSFDGNFLYKWFMRNLPDKYHFLGGKKPTGTYWEIFNNGNKYYSLLYHVKTSIHKNGKKIGTSFNIKFMCSFNMLSSSIDALGKSLKIDKLDKQDMQELKDKNIIKNDEDFYHLGALDWNTMNPRALEIFISYIKRDVRIAKESMINFEKNIYSLDDVRNNKYRKQNVFIFNTLTIASLAQKLCKNHIYNTQNKNMIRGFYLRKESDYDLAKNWYGGGFTQFNPKYQEIDFIANGVGIDINSSYPHQMTKLLPYGELLEEKPKHSDYLEYYQIEIESAVIKDKYSDLICMKNWKKETMLYRYVEMLSDCTIYYLKEEWEIINEIYYVKVKSIKIWYAKASRWLHKFITKLYKFKEYYKKIGESANSMSYKILLNSLYGSFCKRKQYEVIGYYLEQDKEKIMENYRNNKKEGLSTTIELDDRSFMIAGDTQQKIKLNFSDGELEMHGIRLLELIEKKKYPNILIGATITAYARVQLLSTIMKLGTKNFIYCDTDSIFVKNYTTETIKNYIEMDDTKLGLWGLEMEFKSGRILGAKRYGFKNDDKIKFGFCGIHKSKINKDNWDTLLQSNYLIEDGILQRLEDDYGVILEWKDYVTKTGKH